MADKSLSMAEIQHVLQTEYRATLRELHDERGQEVVDELVQQLFDSGDLGPEDFIAGLEAAKLGHMTPYHGPSAEAIADTIGNALTMLKNRKESPLWQGDEVFRALVDLFEDALGGAQEHFGGPEGRPEPVLDRRPCHSEVVAAKLAEALLNVDADVTDDDVDVQVPDGGGVAIIEMHIQGEHMSLVKEFPTLTAMVIGLTSLAAEIAPLASAADEEEQARVVSSNE